MWARKSSGVRKKYSTPFCSVPRGGRLVQEIEKCRSGTCVIKWLMSVLLPQPSRREMRMAQKLGPHIVQNSPFS